MPLLNLVAPSTGRVVAAGLDDRTVTRIADALDGEHVVSFGSVDELHVADAAVCCLPAECLDRADHHRSTPAAKRNGTILVFVRDDPPADSLANGDGNGEFVCHPADVGSAVHQALERHRVGTRAAELQRRLRAEVDRLIPGTDAASRTLRNAIADAADATVPVAISGGPGCDLCEVAWALHRHGPRWESRFVPLDCRFLASDGVADAWAAAREGATGTIVVDHLESTSAATRTELLRRVHSAASLGSVGDRGPHIVLGLHTKTEAEALEFCRVAGLAVPHVRIPALHRRSEAIPVLAEAIVVEHSRRLGQPPKPLSDTARRLLAEHTWPGNEAELRNVLENALQCEPGPMLTADSLAAWIAREIPDTAGATLRQIERRLIEATFERCRGNREQTANSLGIGIRTLSGKLREYGYPPRGGPGSNRKSLRRAA